MLEHAAKKRGRTAVTQPQLDVANAQKATADAEKATAHAQEQARQLANDAQAHVHGLEHEAHIRNEEYQRQIEELQAQLRATKQAAASASQGAAPAAAPAAPAAEPAAAMDTDSIGSGTPSHNESNNRSYNGSQRSQGKSSVGASPCRRQTDKQRKAAEFKAAEVEAPLCSINGRDVRRGTKMYVLTGKYTSVCTVTGRSTGKYGGLTVDVPGNGKAIPVDAGQLHWSAEDAEAAALDQLSEKARTMDLNSSDTSASQGQSRYAATDSVR
jgi:hypothetical protein